MPELGRLSLPRGVREQVLLAVHVHPAQGATPPNQMPQYAAGNAAVAF